MRKLLLLLLLALPLFAQAPVIDAPAVRIVGDDYTGASCATDTAPALLYRGTIYTCQSGHYAASGGGGGGGATPNGQPGSFQTKNGAALLGTPNFTWDPTQGAAGGIVSQLVADPTILPTIALLNTPGSVPNGIWHLQATFVTEDGETYPPNIVTSTTVTDNTSAGQILVNNFPAITDSRVTGWNLYFTSDFTHWYFIFLDNTQTSYTLNQDPATLTPAPGTFTNANTTGPWFYANDPTNGVSHGFQLTDQGINLKNGSMGFTWPGTNGFITFANGIINNTPLPHGSLTGNEQVQMSDGAGTTGQVASYASDGSLTPVTAGTFAALPASPVEGMMVPVTDSTTNTWGATIAGGGSDHVLAYYDGSAWTVMAN